MTELLRSMLREERGQDLIEYALLAACISLIAVVAIVSVGSGVNRLWTGVEGQVDSIPGSTGS
jgi:Flp pilus assembly protein, pilin Flp